MTHDQETAEIVEAEAALRQAMLAADVAQLQALLADNAIFVDQNGHIITKAMDLETHRSGLLNITRLETGAQHITPLGGVVVAITRIALAGTHADVAFAGDFRYTRVWQRSNDGWRIVSAHASAITDT